MKDADFHYSDWLLTEWARWVRSEFIGSSLTKSKGVGARLINDDTALAVDMAIAKCSDSTRKLIKRVYLWRDISISEAVLAMHLRSFTQEYNRYAA
jgi:hypothetical protein